MANLEERVAQLEKDNLLLSALVSALLERAVRDSSFNGGAELELSPVGLGNASPYALREYLGRNRPKIFPLT